MAKKTEAEKQTAIVKLAPAQAKLLGDTARYICVNAIRRNSDLTEITGQVPFARTPLTDGAIRAARETVQAALAGENAAD